MVEKMMILEKLLLAGIEIPDDMLRCVHFKRDMIVITDEKILHSLIELGKD